MTAEHVDLLDTAHGTRLIARGLDIRQDDPALWVLSHPDEIRKLHETDLEAGAGTILTCTFGANRYWLDRFATNEVARINRTAVEIAREAMRTKGLRASIAGGLGPTALHSEHVFREQFDALADSGVDRIVIETLSYDQIPGLCRILPHGGTIPVFATLWHWGDTPVDTAKRMADQGVAGWGINCMTDPEAIAEVLAELQRAGVPAAILKASARTSEEFLRISLQAIGFGVSSLGGCCGTTPGDLAALRQALALRASRTDHA